MIKNSARGGFTKNFKVLASKANPFTFEMIQYVEKTNHENVTSLHETNSNNKPRNKYNI